MGRPRLSPRCDADIIRHDYLALLDAAIENFHESVEDGRNRDAAMQMFFSDTSEQIVISVGELKRLLSHRGARAFLMEHYLPKFAAFLQEEATRR
ncbi:MAG: hypothetical protein U1E42_00040 [Rhodospirillales bacterium]